MNENLYSAKLGCYKLKVQCKTSDKGSVQAACYDLYSCSDGKSFLNQESECLSPQDWLWIFPVDSLHESTLDLEWLQRKALVFRYHKESLIRIMLKKSLCDGE